MASFEFDGKEYEEASDHQTEWGEKLLEELELTGAEKILDLGCGDGRLTTELAAMVPEGKVLGIDSSRGMITTAREREGDNLVFKLQDINDLDYEAEFDIIFSNAALHWVKDHENLLKNCRKALQEGGIVRFNFGAAENCSNLYAVLREVMELPEYRGDFEDFNWPWYMPTISKYRQLVSAEKFTRYKVWGENRDRYFADREEMVRWIKQPCIVPFLEQLPEEKEGAFSRAVIERMISRCEEEDGRCFETFRRLNLLAVR